MSGSEFDLLISRMALRIRMVQTIQRAFLPTAVALAIASAGIVTAKLLSPALPRNLAWAVAALAGATALVTLAVSWLRRHATRLTAAAEIDRVAGLKERASSLVAARSGAVPASAAGLALEKDAEAALATLDPDTVFLQAWPVIPMRTKMLTVLAAISLVALIVPSRNPPAEPSIAEMLADGGEILQLARARAGGISDPHAAAEPPRGRAAKKAIAILGGAPPRNAADAARNKQDLLKAAEEFRKNGSAEDRILAGKLEAVAERIARLAGAPSTDGAGGSQGYGALAPETPGVDYRRHHPEYADLLARYFGTE
ncbi:MAG TPA: hypothetical protein PK280_18850 [Planctomycetota bacterium]|nr:hypothetical protein [Planctomycetota bacterium]